MVKKNLIVGIVTVIVLTLVLSFCPSCNKNYLSITNRDFAISNIPPNWTVKSKEEIAKAQDTEEKNLGYDPSRIKANVLLSAGLNRSDGNSYPNVVVEVIPLENFKTINEIINYNESIYEKNFKG